MHVPGYGCFNGRLEPFRHPGGCISRLFENILNENKIMGLSLCLVERNPTTHVSTSQQADEADALIIQNFILPNGEVHVGRGIVYAVQSLLHPAV